MAHSADKQVSKQSEHVRLLAGLAVHAPTPHPPPSTQDVLP